MMVPIDVVVRQITCGACHTAVVTENGQVYTWGEGRKGELGHNQQDPSVKQTPRLVENLEHVFVVQVACGAAHTVALTDNGLLYSWGWARHGQTGHDNRLFLKGPRKIDHLQGQGIRFVACGNNHTVAINKKGQALSWGCGKQGQTGHGDDQDVLVPTVIADLKDQVMSHVACGAIHTCFVTEEGEVWLMGFGEHFSPNETQHFFYNPTLIKCPEPIKQIGCGQSHNVALSHTGNVYCWGSGEYGQNGYGIKSNVSTPRLVLDTGNIAQVAAGRYHSFALTNTGVLYSWGCGENGQLGLESDENVALPSVLTSILGTVVGQVSCGEHHTAVLTSAPWSKLDQDVMDWLRANRYEHELKMKIIKQTHKGLARKDLVKIKEEMKRWLSDEDQRKREAMQQEEESRKRDLESIEKKDVIIKSVTMRLGSADGMRTGALSLPPIGSESKPEQELLVVDEPVDEKAATSTKFPSIAARSTSHMDRAPSDPEKALVSLRHTSSRNQTQELMANTSSLVPFSRTSFLKETAQMVKRITTIVQDKGEAQTQLELAHTSKQVTGMRKEYDSLRHQCQSKGKLLKDLKKELELLDTANKLSDVTQEECNKRLQALNMQLNTVMIKIAETGENRKNYELNIAHLKEEDFEHFNQLKSLRKQMQDNNNFFKKINEMKLQSMEEKEKTEAELNEFQKEINNYQRFVVSQLEQFQQLLGVTRSHTDQRDAARTMRSDKSRAKIEQRMAKLLVDATTADEVSLGLTTKLTGLDHELRRFEEAYSKIVAATGLSDPDAIVNKYFFKNEIKEQLVQEVADKQATAAALRKQEEDLRAQLASLQANHRDDKWRDVAIVTDKSREVETKAAKSQTESEKVTQRAALIQEGLVNLLRNMESFTTDQSPEDDLEVTRVWTAEQCMDVFQRLNKAVSQLMKHQGPATPAKSEAPAKTTETPTGAPQTERAATPADASVARSLPQSPAPAPDAAPSQTAESENPSS